MIAGGFVGSLFGLLWYGLLEYGLYPSGFVQSIVDHPLSKRLYLRDLRAIDNVARWEYQQWEQQVRNKRKNNQVENKQK